MDVKPLNSGRTHPVDWTVQAGAIDDVLGQLEVRLHRKRRRRVGIVAGAILGSAAAALIWQLRPVTATPTWGSPQPSAVLLSPERQVLTDGSSVELRPGAKISVAFSAASRRVILERGEALFTVAKDSRRPFLVDAQGLQVRAVGTAFAVSLEPKSVDVLVTEGRVAVDTAAGGITAASVLSSPVRTLTFIDAGNRARLQTSPLAGAAQPPRVVAVSPSELAADLSWEVPRLQFSSTPLSEAIALFNRHSAVKLVLADPALGSVHLSGIIRADNVGTLVALLEEQNGIRATSRGDHEIVLGQAP